MLNEVFGVKHPVNLARRDSSSKTRQNDTVTTWLFSKSTTAWNEMELFTVYYSLFTPQRGTR